MMLFRVWLARLILGRSGYMVAMPLGVAMMNEVRRQRRLDPACV